MANTATARINPKKQTLEDAYSPPANFLEIDIVDPQTHGVAKARYTDYEVRMKVGRQRATYGFVTTPLVTEVLPYIHAAVSFVFTVISFSHTGFMLP